MQKKRVFRGLCCCILLWGLDLLLIHWIQIWAVFGNLNLYSAQSEEFRKQEISAEAYEKLEEFSSRTQTDLIDGMTVFLIMNRFRLTGHTKMTESEFERGYRILTQYKSQDYHLLKNAVAAVWQGIIWFPTAADSRGSTVTDFEDSWMSERNYQGSRRHEGCDIFCWEQGQTGGTLRGYYPVVSVTDGYVEQIGWLPLGGYRIGIRSPEGGYFYYAHLYSYAQEFQAGDRITAGQMLGLMGDSGYGDEGTVGQFPVHLHFGIYFNAQDGSEVSVNPYPVLCILENRRKEYTLAGEGTVCTVP